MALIKCRECGHEISDKVKQCPNCGYKLKQNNMNFNKKNLIIIGVVLVAIISGGGLLYYTLSNGIETNVNKIETLLEKNNYGEAYKIINDKKMLSKAKDKIDKLITEKLSQYKVSTIDDFLNLSINDWNNINSFEKMIEKLNLTKKYTYLSKLIEINNKYYEYIPAISWFNSEDYETFNSYLELEDMDDFQKSANLLKNYSFEKYGLENIYIKELNEAIKEYITYCEQLTTALNYNNYTLATLAIDKLKENEDTLYNTKVEIIEKSSSLEEEIKNL